MVGFLSCLDFSRGGEQQLRAERLDLIPAQPHRQQGGLKTIGGRAAQTCSENKTKKNVGKSEPSRSKTSGNVEVPLRRTLPHVGDNIITLSTSRRATARVLGTPLSAPEWEEFLKTRACLPGWTPPSKSTSEANRYCREPSTSNSSAQESVCVAALRWKVGKAGTKSCRLARSSRQLTALGQQKRLEARFCRPIRRPARRKTVGAPNDQPRGTDQPRRLRRPMRGTAAATNQSPSPRRVTSSDVACAIDVETALCRPAHSRAHEVPAGGLVPASVSEPRHGARKKRDKTRITLDGIVDRVRKRRIKESAIAPEISSSTAATISVTDRATAPSSPVLTRGPKARAAPS